MSFVIACPMDGYVRYLTSSSTWALSLDERRVQWFETEAAADQARAKLASPERAKAYTKIAFISK